jgi:hypothetical protein
MFMATLPAPSITTASPEAPLLQSIGRLICAWGMLEQDLERKLVDMRAAVGDVRSAAARTKPSMGKLLAELRAMVSMRDRRNGAALQQIAAIECDIQRIDRFRSLIVGGFQESTGRDFVCRDAKNNAVRITIPQLQRETEALEGIAERLLAL